MENQGGWSNFQAFTDQGVAILGGPETVLANIEKIYGIRLGEINERYTDSVHIVDEYIVATEDLGESISNVEIDLSDYLLQSLSGSERTQSMMMSAYRRESKVFEDDSGQVQPVCRHVTRL